MPVGGSQLGEGITRSTGQGVDIFAMLVLLNTLGAARGKAQRTRTARRGPVATG